MFAEFYRKQLAKRLLLNRSASDDDERSLITKLKYTLHTTPYALHRSSLHPTLGCLETLNPL